MEGEFPVMGDICWETLKGNLGTHIPFSGQAAQATSPYLGQGERCLLAGAAPHPELSRLHSLTRAFAVDINAVVGQSTCWPAGWRGAALLTVLQYNSQAHQVSGEHRAAE